MQIKVEKQRCAGHARCAAVAPELFELDDDGYIAFETRKIESGQAAQAQRGARACPERIIVIED